MTSPVSGNDPLDITEFNADLVESTPEELNTWYGAYQTFYPGASVPSFEQAMLAFANAYLAANANFDPTNPTAFTQFLGAAAATTATVNPSSGNPVTNNFLDSDTSTPTPAPSQLLATWVSTYKQYNPGDTTSLADIEQGTDLQFDESLGSFIQTAQASGTSYAPSDATFEQYQGQTVLANFSSSEAAAWQAAYMQYNPGASLAEFQASVGQFASQQSSPVSSSELQAFQNAALDNALSPPVASWQAVYSNYFPGGSTASFQTFLDSFVNGLSAQLTVANSSQFFAQFQGYAVANSAAFQASGGAGAQAWQNVYKQYNPGDTSTDPLTDTAFLTFLGQFSSQQSGPLDPVNSLSQFQGAVAASALSSTQLSLLQAIYTQANPGASNATFLSYLGGLAVPQPPTPDGIAGVLTSSILSPSQLASWLAAYQEYFPGSTTEQFQNFLGNFVLTQPTAINPNNPNSLLQFSGAAVLSYFPQASVVQWQAYYQKYYPSGTEAEFQLLVGQVNSEQGGQKLDPVNSFKEFQDVVLDSSLTPGLPTWQAFYDSLGLNPDDFQTDLDAFAATQPAPMDPTTSFAGFINHLFTTYPTNANVKTLNDTWQTAYNQNFQQGSIPEPFTSALARYATFQGGTIDPSDSTSFINWTNSMSQVDFSSWQAFYNEIYPGTSAPTPFQTFLTNFTTTQLPTSLPNATTTVDPLSTSNPLQLFEQFQGATLLSIPSPSSPSSSLFAGVQALYNAYNPIVPPETALTQTEQFETFLGGVATQLLANQQGAIASGSITAQQVLVNDLPQINGAVIESSLSPTQAALLQGLYTNANPNALAGDFQAYLGGLTLPAPATPVQIAGAEANDILNQEGQLANWQNAYNNYSSSLPAGTTFQTFLGNFVLAQPLPIDSVNSLTQFNGALGLGILPATVPTPPNTSTQANWQAAYTQYYPNGTTADFQTFVGQFASTQPGGVVSVSIPLSTFQNAVLDSVLVPPLVTWQAVYESLGLPPSGSNATFQSDLNTFIAGQPSPLNPDTLYQSFVSHLLNEYGTSISIPNTWQKAYNQNFQQGSIPTPFSAQLASYLAFQYQVNAGGISDAAVAAGQQAMNGFTQSQITAWQSVYDQYNPGATSNQFYNFVGLFAALQPGGTIDPTTSLPQFTTQVASGQGTRGALVNPTAVAAGQYALANFSPAELTSWQTIYNASNPGADLDEFYGFVGELVSQIPVGPIKQANGQIIPGTAADNEFQAQVANTAFVSWNNSMSQVDFASYQDAYLELFPNNTAAQFQTSVLNYTSTLPVPLSPSNPTELYNQFVGAALLYGGAIGTSQSPSPTVPPYSTFFQTFYDQYNPGATTAQFETFLGQYANQLLTNNEAGIGNGTLNPASLIANAYSQAPDMEQPPAVGITSFQQAVVDDSFTAALSNYTGTVNALLAQNPSATVPAFIFPPSGTATVVPSGYASWYAYYQQVVPGATVSGFQAVLNNFIKNDVAQGVAIDPSQSQLYNQFQGAAIEASLSAAGQLSTWQNFYDTYFNETTAPFDTYLGQFLNQQGGVINPVSSFSVFEQQVVNDAFNKALASPGSGLISGFYVNPGVVPLPSAYQNWYTLFNQMLPGGMPNTASQEYQGAQFPALFIGFLTTVKSTGGTIDPTQTLPYFLGEELAASNPGVYSSTWQQVYAQLNPNFDPNNPQDYFTVLGNYVLQQAALGNSINETDPNSALNPSNASNTTAWTGAVLESLLTPTQASSLQALYNSTHPGATAADFQAYLGGLTTIPQPPTAVGIAGALAASILSADNQLTNWQNAYAPYSSSTPFQTALGNFVLAQSTPIDPVNSLTQFTGVAALSTLPQATQASWQAAYMQYYPSGTTTQFQSFVGQFASTQPGGISASTPLSTFQNALLNSTLVPPVATWQAVYSSLGLSANNFQTDLNNFITSQGAPLDPNTGFQSFVSYLLNIYSTNPTVQTLENTWQMAYNQNFQQGSIPTPFTTQLANYLAFEYQVNAGGISDAAVAAGQQAISGFSSANLTAWENAYNQYNPGATSSQFYNFVGLFAALQPGGMITPSLLPQFTTQVASGQGAGGAVVSPASIAAGQQALSGFSQADINTWQSYYNQYNPGASLDEFYAYVAQFASQLPVGPLKQANGQIISSSTSLAEFQAQVANTAFVNWTNSMSQVDFSSWQTAYEELFPTNTASQFQSFLLNFTSTLPTPISLSDPTDPTQFYNQFVGAALLDNGTVGGSSSTYAALQTFYDQYNNIGATPTAAQTAQFEAYLGQFANQLLASQQSAIQSGATTAQQVLSNADSQFQGAVIENFLNPTQAALLQGLYTQANPTATDADFQNYLGSLTIPQPLTAAGVAGAVADSILTQEGQINNWTGAYNKYYSSTPAAFQTFLGNFVLAQSTPIDPVNSLTQFNGALALSVLPATGSTISSQASWQAAYTQYYPNGTTAQFQTFVGQFASTQPGGVVSANIPLATFQNAVQNSVLVPPAATWEAVYTNLMGSSTNFQSDLNNFINTQTLPLNPSTEYQSFIGYLFNTYGTNSPSPNTSVEALQDTWEKAYNQNFAQGSIPTTFAAQLASYLAFKYQVNAGGISNAAVAAGQQVTSAAGFPATDPNSSPSGQTYLQEWENYYNQYNPGASLDQFYNFMGLFANLQPSGSTINPATTSASYTQFQALVASGGTLGGASVSAASVSAGQQAASGFTSAQLTQWQTFYNSYNPGASLNQFYAFLGQFDSQVPIGQLKLRNGQLDINDPKYPTNSTTLYTQFQAQVANSAFVSWTGNMSQVDFTGWQTVYSELFPDTAGNFQQFLTTFTSQLPAPISPSNPQQFFNQFVGAALLDNGTVGGSSSTYASLQNFYDNYNNIATPPGPTTAQTAQFEAYLGQFANQLLASNQTGIQNGTVDPTTLLTNPSTQTQAQFQQQVVDDTFTTALSDYTTTVNALLAQNPSATPPSFVFPPSGTIATLVPSAYASWYTDYQQAAPGGTITGFQTALNLFITAEVPQGVTINPTQSLPLFIGGILSNPPTFETDPTIQDTLKAAVYNYLQAGGIGLEDPDNSSNIITTVDVDNNMPLLSPLSSGNEAQIYGAIQIANPPDSAVPLITVDLGPLPWISIGGQGQGPQNPFIITLSLSTSGQLSSNAPILNPSNNNVTIPAGAPITDPTLESAVTASLVTPFSTVSSGFASWQALFNQNNLGLTQAEYNALPPQSQTADTNQFLAALGTFFLNQSSQGPQGTGNPTVTAALTTAGNTAEAVLANAVNQPADYPLSSWLNIYKGENPSDTSTPTQPSQQFLAFLGQFYNSLSSTQQSSFASNLTADISLFSGYIVTTAQTPTPSLIAAGNTAVGAIDSVFSSWLSFYKTYNPTDTSTVTQPSQQFLAFLGQFYNSLSSAEQSVFAADPDSFIATYQSQVMSINYQTTGLTAISSFSTAQISNWWNYYKQYNLADTSTSAQKDPSFLAFVGQLAVQQSAQGSSIDPVNSFAAFQTLVNTTNYTNWSNYVLGVPPTSVLPKITLDANDTVRRQQALVLNNLFAVLDSMIGTIQQAVVTVGNRLNFYATYQQETTSEISAMPVYTVSGPSSGTAPNITYNPIADPNETDPNKQNTFAQYQSSANALVQSRQASLRALGDSVGSLTQQLQTTITQLNDAATNQGSIGTSILQTLSSILTLIFR